MAKALFNINAAYLMADIADSFAIEAESALRQLQKGVNYGELKKFKSVANVARQLRDMSRKLASPVYDLTDAELACDNSDFIKECVTLIATRCRDDEESKQRLIRKIKEGTLCGHVIWNWIWKKFSPRFVLRLLVRYGIR